MSKKLVDSDDGLRMKKEVLLIVEVCQIRCLLYEQSHSENLFQIFQIIIILEFMYYIKFICDISKHFEDRIFNRNLEISDFECQEFILVEKSISNLLDCQN